MALLANPYEMDNPTAYHRVVRTERQPGGDVVADLAVYESRQARLDGADPIQMLTVFFETDLENLTQAAYLAAKANPMWEDAVDV